MPWQPISIATPPPERLTSQKCGACGPSCFSDCLTNVGLPSGVYWLDPDGKGPGGKFQAYCDQLNELGGWTLLMKTDGTKQTFAYESSYWSDIKTYNANAPGLDKTEAKLASFATLPFTHLRLGMAVGDTIKWIYVTHTSKSLYDVLKDGKHKATKVGRNFWKSLLTGSSLQLHCNQAGFNVGGQSQTHSRVRIGIIANQENDCDTPDSRLGFGGRGDSCGQDNNNTTGNEAYCLADNGAKSIKAFGYIMAR